MAEKRRSHTVVSQPRTAARAGWVVLDRIPGAVVVTMPAEIADADVTRVAGIVFDLALGQEGAHTIIVDFAHTEHAHFRVAQYINLSARLMRPNGGRLVLTGVSSYLLAVLRVGGLDEHAVEHVRLRASA